MSKKELIREYAKSHRYFSLTEIVKATGTTKKLAKKYLNELKQKGITFSAGRGFYSSIEKEFKWEEKNRVIEIKQLLKKHYPELDFLIWNTLYFQPYYHHQQTHNITFVEVESDAIHPVADRISGDYRFVMIEKASRLAPESFDITHDPIVIRQLIKKSPRVKHTPTLEKMLIDLFVIKDKYGTMSDNDYWELWSSIDSLFRINISSLIAYAKARRYLRSILSQLVDNQHINEVSFSAYLKSAKKVTSRKDRHGKKSS